MIKTFAKTLTKLLVIVLLSVVFVFMINVNKNKFFDKKQKNWQGFHISLSQIEYSKKAKVLKVTFTFILEDFRKSLNKFSQKNIFLGQVCELSEVDTVITNYLQENFKIKINDTLPFLLPKYIGKEIEASKIWCFIEYEDIKNTNCLIIYNNLLTNIFASQINYVHFFFEDFFDETFLSKQKNEEQICW